jgi:hypothetical protein
MQRNLHECLCYSFLLFFQEYSYLGEGECDVPAMSHVTEGSHVPALANLLACLLAHLLACPLANLLACLLACLLANLLANLLAVKSDHVGKVM